MRLSSLASPHSQTRVHSSVVVAENPLVHRMEDTLTQLSPNGTTELEAFDGTMDVKLRHSFSYHQDHSVSTNLLTDGHHSLLFTFPWEKERPDSDFPMPIIVEQSPTPTPEDLASGEALKPAISIICSGEGLGTSTTSALKGMDGERKRGRHKSAVVQIKMDDEGMSEKERWQIAEEKWKERRTQMDVELLRIKRNQQNQERVRRHSYIDSPGKEKERQNKRRRIKSSAAGLNVDFEPSEVQLRAGWKQSMSVPVADQHAHAHQRNRNALDTHPELMDEEEGLGLPPKDVPYFEPDIGPQDLNMSQIPPLDIMVVDGSTDDSGHWNTLGEQDSSF